MIPLGQGGLSSRKGCTKLNIFSSGESLSKLGMESDAVFGKTAGYRMFHLRSYTVTCTIWSGIPIVMSVTVGRRKPGGLISKEAYLFMTMNDGLGC